jgi:hypothetical protein
VRTAHWALLFSLVALIAAVAALGAVYQLSQAGPP